MNGLTTQWVGTTTPGDYTWIFPIQFTEIPLVWKGYYGNSSTSLQWRTFAGLAINTLSKTQAVFGGIGSVYTKVYAFAIGY